MNFKKVSVVALSGTL
ncbi:Protein of unknown function [Bacillus cytotoxicus]|uniref:Uncharacterized protein n=1 Tax=Bacillus cytotoxicus TaxID=580165 RepID=A0AAX2CIT6_9BACI|nr:Protein of unknown function [Bacillus cytotoxicus]SCN38753.1 Protein of unknown function [Bacillus cytotoxicus]